ncbi:MAG: hypothetical protein AAFY88_18305 [Acidobacteriota bacterium]
MLLITAVVATVVITVMTTSLYMGFVAARSNGWGELAGRYRFRGEAPPHRLRFQSATLNEYSFPGVMQLAPLREGLWLKPVLLFFHPPILVPWGVLGATRLANRFEVGVRLRGTSGPRFDCDLNESVRAGLLKAADVEWRGAAEALLADIPVAASPGQRAEPGDA